MQKELHCSPSKGFMNTKEASHQLNIMEQDAHLHTAPSKAYLKGAHVSRTLSHSYLNSVDKSRRRKGVTNRIDKNVATDLNMLYAREAKSSVFSSGLTLKTSILEAKELLNLWMSQH
ncbi:hypothetical protein Y1Q_0003166 [Alligator mississippiensis]|uniref:Uncharacterized protein n=1 Tax=Alligator mississippiensis TaxID=8496 RepID=A0A151ME27_ALLMI|nr:hypothetical protein Y1Q_0003166 [Alligator mississippiensis]